MSSRLATIVWDHYPEGGGELLTALALAEHGDPDGSNIWPSVATISGMTRQSERAIQYHMRRMMERQWLLVVEQGGGRSKPTKYRVPVEWIPQHLLGTAQKLHRLCANVRGDASPSTAAVDNSTETVQSGVETVQKGCNNGAKTVQGKGANGATAIAPDQGTSTSDQEVTPPPPPSRARKGKTTIPVDFGISEGIRTWARANRFEPFLEAHLAYFIDYAKSTGKSYADWDGAFRNCMRADWGDVRKNLLRSGFKPEAASLCEEPIGAAGEICGMPAKPRGGGVNRCDHHEIKHTERTRAPMPPEVRQKIHEFVGKHRGASGGGR